MRREKGPNHRSNNESPIELLPVELKLEILLLADFPTIFRLCKAAPSFSAVLRFHSRLVQSTVVRQQGHTKESLELLDRFRPCPSGMGILSITIFASIHSWLGEKDEFCCFAPPKEIENTQRKLSRNAGVIGCLEDALFLVKLEDFMDMLYSKARLFGHRTPQHRVLDLPTRWEDYTTSNASVSRYLENLRTEMQTPGDETEDDSETRAMIRKALLQFMIITTHFHDKSFAEETMSELGGDDEIGTLIRREDLSRRAWLSATRKKRRGCAYSTPPTVYDLSYVQRLSISEIATILSVATPVIHSLYSPPPSESQSSFDSKAEFWDLRVIRRFHLNRCTPSVYVAPHAEYATEMDEFAETEEADSFLYSYIWTVGAGAWRPEYRKKLADFEREVERFPELRMPAVCEARFKKKKIVASVPATKSISPTLGPVKHMKYHTVDILALKAERSFFS
ncbi:hypothetical protein BJ508DRAFT_303263 [Ascobolus immersus RN42]|uniref:F-box domain-containing protein n=1 Tax=Ascobolus immersus RN42 TaxID=1160509 RepID=A0A3N4IFC9_ASCIM|nr:hypothetical protein BJ508DRAFT_303263 [Ascobolus immersus RN42]